MKCISILIKIKHTLYFRSPAIICLGLSAGKFQDDSGAGSSNIEAMFAKAPVNKMKATETSTSCDSDSDVETTLTVKKDCDIESTLMAKKGTIQSFFTQVQRSDATEVTRTESDSCDIVDIDFNKVKKEKKSIASFFKSKLSAKLDDKQEKDSKEDLDSNDLPTETDSLNINKCKKTINPNGMDSFLTPEGNEIDSVGRDRHSVSEFCVVDSDSSNNSDNGANDNELQRQTGMCFPVINGEIVTGTNDSVNQLKYDAREILTLDENLATCDKSENVSLKSSEPVSDNALYDNFTNVNGTCTGAVQNFAPEDYLPCEKCRKPIAVWEMPEHMDFHFAMDLQKDMNAVTSQVLSSNTGKRKSVGSDNRGSKKTKISPSQGKLDSFFGRKT